MKASESKNQQQASSQNSSQLFFGGKSTGAFFRTARSGSAPFFYKPDSAIQENLTVDALGHKDEQTARSDNNKVNRIQLSPISAQQSSTIQRLSSQENIEERAQYSGGKKSKTTWKMMMKKIEKYNKINSYDKDKEGYRKVLLSEIQMMIKEWLSKAKHQQMTRAVETLNSLYHEAATELYALETEGVTGLGGGYAGKVSLMHPQRRGKEEGKTKLGSQGYKLHVSYKNEPENVDKVIKAIGSLQTHSLKIVKDPQGLVGTQQNKFVALYPKLTPVVTADVKLSPEAQSTEEVTWYEASRDEAENLAFLVATVMDIQGVEPGGPVPNEEQLNEWTYTRFGSFTGKETYRIRDGFLEKVADVKK